MSKVFHRLYYHIVWTTKYRQPIITEEIEKFLFPFLENKAKRFGCKIHKCNGTEDHIHIAISIPPAECVSDIIGKLKGSSSYFLNKELQITENFYWQDGYGVMSFAERNLPSIVKYIEKQKEHHRENKLNKKMEITIGDDYERQC
jgi:REP element-mobilizing transposase RayT